MLSELRETCLCSAWHRVPRAVLERRPSAPAASRRLSTGRTPRPRGLPALDLIYFLASYAFAIEGAGMGGVESARESNRRLLDPTRARRVADDLRRPSTATGIDLDAPVSLLCWTVQALIACRRLLGTTDSVPAAADAELLLRLADDELQTLEDPLTTTPTPELSILIASHNRSELLRRCLDSLCQQTAEPGSFEVIVADDGSSDGTAAMVEGLDAPFPLRLLRLEQGGQVCSAEGRRRIAPPPVCLFSTTICRRAATGRRAPGRPPRATRELGIGGMTGSRSTDDRDWYARAFARLGTTTRRLKRREDRWNDC